MNRIEFYAFAKIAAALGALTTTSTKLTRSTVSKSFQMAKQPPVNMVKGNLEGQPRNFTLKKMTVQDGVKPVQISSAKRSPVKPVEVRPRAQVLRP